MPVNDIDKGMQEILSDLKELSEFEIKVGIQSGDTNSDGQSLAEIAAYNEFGTGRIPARPFLRSSVEEHNNWTDETERVWNGVINGDVTPQYGAELIGDKAASDIQEKLTAGPWVPNAPSTIARKGSDRPLIDTGELRRSIAYKVTRGGDSE